MDYSIRQRDQLLRIQQSMSRKAGGNSLTYSAYAGLRGEFTYSNGDPVNIYPVIDNEGNIIAMTWDGDLRGPIQGSFTHNGNILGTQFVNIQNNLGVWTPFLLNFIPSQCLPGSEVIGTTPGSGPSTTPGQVGGGPVSPADPRSPNLPPTGPIVPQLPTERDRTIITPPATPVPPDSVVLCIQGFYVAKTGINYIPTDRILLRGFETDFVNRGTELIPRLDADGRIVGVDIEGDTCNLPFMPVPYVASVTGSNSKLIPIPSVTPVTRIPAPGTDGKYINADGTVVSSPVKTVYCYTH